MFLSTAVKYLSLTTEVTKLSILSAMEYRLSFLMQVVGMFINDIGLIFIWVIFFQKFTSIAGWRFPDMALLFAISTVNNALLMIFFRGVHHLGRYITRGEMDYYLTFPKNILWHASASKTDISSIGDLIFGLTIFFLFAEATFDKLVIFITTSILSAAILYNFSVVTQAVTFWAGNFEEAAEQIYHALSGLTLYPQTAFYGWLKVVTLTILPAFFIATLPVQLLQVFNIWLFLSMVAFWFFTFLLAIFIFRKGLQRYESGNLINVNM